MLSRIPYVLGRMKDKMEILLISYPKDVTLLSTYKDLLELKGEGNFQEDRWCEHNKNIEGIYKHCDICYPKK